MARLPTPKREELSAEGQAVYDKILQPDGRLRGPHAALIYVPPVSDRVNELGNYLRGEGGLPEADRELAICATVREGEARFAWQAHEATGRRVGTRPEAIEILRNKGPLDGLTQRERVIVEVVRSLARENGLSDDLFRRAMDELGREGLVELVALSGYYRLVGYVLNAFQVDLPPNAAPTF
jgi:4-carboxymuconolactone decarboxylase